MIGIVIAELRFENLEIHKSKKIEFLKSMLVIPKFRDIREMANPGQDLSGQNKL